MSKRKGREEWGCIICWLSVFYKDDEWFRATELAPMRTAYHRKRRGWK
jgi:hypothetical protein